MKRRLIMLLLLLVGGGIVNVAVAWGSVALQPSSARACAIATTPDGGHVMRFTYRFNEATHMWPRVAGTFTRPRDTGSFDGVLPDWGRNLYDDLQRLKDPERNVWPAEGIGTARGFPQLSLQGYVIHGTDSKYLVTSSVIDIHPLVSRFHSEHNAWLPLRPIWPGFAINTVFYAVVLWLLFAGPFVVRRWRRIRRGLCPKCAYDLRGTVSPTCPECGMDRHASQSRKATD